MYTFGSEEVNTQFYETNNHKIFQCFSNQNRKKAKKAHTHTNEPEYNMYS